MVGSGSKACLNSVRVRRCNRMINSEYNACTQKPWFSSTFSFLASYNWKLALKPKMERMGTRISAQPHVLRSERADGFCCASISESCRLVSSLGGSCNSKIMDVNATRFEANRTIPTSIEKRHWPRARTSSNRREGTKHPGYLSKIADRQKALDSNYAFVAQIPASRTNSSNIQLQCL